MASQFSNDGKYFAQFSNDGKLQIWETKENKFQQEYTPEFHLTSPCTCFHFINQNCVINKVTMCFFICKKIKSVFKAFINSVSEWISKKENTKTFYGQ